MNTVNLLLSKIGRQFVLEAKIFKGFVGFRSSLCISSSSFSIGNHKVLSYFAKLSWVFVVDSSWATVGWHNSHKGITKYSFGVSTEVQKVRGHIVLTSCVSSCCWSHKKIVLIMSNDGPVAVNDGNFHGSFLFLENIFEFWGHPEQHGHWESSCRHVEAGQWLDPWIFELIPSFIAQSQVKLVGWNEDSIGEGNSAHNRLARFIKVQVDRGEGFVFFPNSSELAGLLFLTVI